MSPLEQYRVLARYNRWMNRKLYAVAFMLDDADRKRDLGASFGSMHGTLNHLLRSDRTWMLRFTGDHERYTSRDLAGAPIQIGSLRDELYADFDVLHRERERTDEDLLEWMYAVDETVLDSTLEYSSSGGERQSHVLWWAVGHLFNHQTHHRGQVCNLLKQLAHDPGVTDLVAMCREETIPTR
jgi:uncharacterized damage-inducible protein DinB